MKQALVDESNVVKSVIVWPSSDYKAPDGFTLLSVTNTKIGDTYDAENSQTLKQDGSVRESVTVVE